MQMTGMTYKIQEMARRIRELREITGLSVEEIQRITNISLQPVFQAPSRDPPKRGLPPP